MSQTAILSPRPVSIVDEEDEDALLNIIPAMSTNHQDSEPGSNLIPSPIPASPVLEATDAELPSDESHKSTPASTPAASLKSALLASPLGSDVSKTPRFAPKIAVSRISCPTEPLTRPAAAESLSDQLSSAYESTAGHDNETLMDSPSTQYAMPAVAPGPVPFSNTRWQYYQPQPAPHRPRYQGYYSSPSNPMSPTYTNRSWQQYPMQHSAYMAPQQHETVSGYQQGWPPGNQHLSPTGYELLAAKLSGYQPQTPVRPIYRRFQSLHHRLLLGLQDEICSLEEQLSALDKMDSRRRLHLDSYDPASRRMDYLSPNDVAGARADVVANIQTKIGQYSRALESFKVALSFGEASGDEVDDYRAFLRKSGAIVETETRFLQRDDDLMCIYDFAGSVDVETLRTAMSTPTPETIARFDSGRRHNLPKAAAVTDKTDGMSALQQYVLGTALAVAVPMLSFQFIPWFLARMMVVCFVGICALSVLSHSGVLAVSEVAAADAVMLVGVYGLVMLVIAGTSA